MNAWRVQKPVGLLLGLWLLSSPWVLAYVWHKEATWDAILSGIVLLAIALVALFRPWIRPAWANVAVGLWLAMSPWVLGFGHLTGAKWNVVAIGAAITLLGLWSIWMPGSTDHEHGRSLSRPAG
jgi:hypothetical protein